MLFVIAAAEKVNEIGPEEKNKKKKEMRMLQKQQKKMEMNGKSEI